MSAPFPAVLGLDTLRLPALRSRRHYGIRVFAFRNSAAFCDRVPLGLVKSRREDQPVISVIDAQSASGQLFSCSRLLDPCVFSAAGLCPHLGAATRKTTGDKECRIR